MSFFNNKYISVYRDEELEAFYDIDVKYRRKIIIAHMMIHLFPLLLVVLYFWQYSDYQYAKIAIGIGVIYYIGVIAETVSYLFPSSRQFYKKNILWISIPFFILSAIGGGFLGYELMTMSYELETDTDIGFGTIAASIFIITSVFIWAYVGLSQIFSASRAIYKRKAAMEADMRFASEVQNRILKEISVESAETGAYGCSLPANELGGDFFELALHDDQLFASIGDISGHSFGAGLLMTMTKSALQTHLQYNRDPAKIMDALNTMMMSQTDRAMYATMTMLKVDMQTQKVTLCNAGHLPIIQIKENSQEIIYRHKKGIGLGISGDADYSNLEFSVEKGDLLILYSDGLIETRNEEMQIRESDFFEKIIMENLNGADLSSKDLALKLLDHVKKSDYSKEMEDDCTIIVIRV